MELISAEVRSVEAQRGVMGLKARLVMTPAANIAWCGCKTTATQAAVAEVRAQAESQGNAEMAWCLQVVRHLEQGLCHLKGCVQRSLAAPSPVKRNLEMTSFHWIVLGRWDAARPSATHYLGISLLMYSRARCRSVTSFNRH